MTWSDADGRNDHIGHMLFMGSQALTSSVITRQDSLLASSCALATALHKRCEGAIWLQHAAAASCTCRVKLAGLRHSLTEEKIAALARSAHGFVGADIAALCGEAAMTALRRHVAAHSADTPARRRLMHRAQILLMLSR